MPLLLTEADVRSLVSMDDLIAAMEDALVEFSLGRAQQPVRSVLQIGAAHAFFGVMPAYVPASDAMGTKLVTVFASNAAAGLPSHLATIVMLDPSTGALRAIVDGRYITEARTAAVSAVSTRLLAQPDAGVLAIIGSGVQAKSHLEAIGRVRQLREVRVWSPSEARRRAFAEQSRTQTEAGVIATASPREAVDGADIVALVSASTEPVVEHGWIAAGAHICAVGACRPNHREMDTALVRQARVFVDSRAGALAEAGDLIIPMQEGAIDASHIAGELGELAAGRVPGRTDRAQVTIFKSLGMAVEDVTAAQLVVRRAVALGVGQPIAW